MLKAKGPAKRYSRSGSGARPQEPAVSKDRMLEYAMDAAKREVVKRYPEADYSLKGWMMFFTTVARTAEKQFDDRTNNGATLFRVDHLVLKQAFQHLVNEMLDAAVTDPDFMRLCGVSKP